MNKIYGILAIVMFISMLTIPLAATKQDKVAPKETFTWTYTTKTAKTTKKPDEDIIRVYDKQNDKVIEMNISDYVLGVIASEMPADFEVEALKAQAVAAYSVALKRREEQAKSPNSELKGADLSNDSAKDQGYITVEQQKEKWGKNYDSYSKKLKQAVESVLKQRIVCDNKPILAAYHAISGGKTEAAKNVWGNDYKYLQPVESVGDMLAPGYISTVSYTKEEFIEKAKSLDLNLSGEIDSFLYEPVCTESGTVKEYKLGGTMVSGQKMRAAFNLRSANFDLSVKDDKLLFTVRGYGHGVGMSQYGANYMAKQGSDYKEILLWYYTGCTIQ